MHLQPVAGDARVLLDRARRVEKRQADVLSMLVDERT
jgi:hypothetical protein